MGSVPIRPRCVLVIDDDQGIREAILETLRDDGFEVQEAADGREALDIINDRTDESFMLLLDLMMPRVSGWQLLGALEQEGRLRDIPVVVISALRSDAARLPARIRFLKKPFEMNTLLGIVEQVCERTRTPFAANGS